MSISDLVSGKVTEPLSVLALVGEGTVQPSDVLALADRHSAHMVDLRFRPPDPLANRCLAFPAMLMAGLDGIERELDLGGPIDLNLYELAPEELADIPTVPTTLDEALDVLEADHAFLTHRGVFTDDLIAT